VKRDALLAVALALLAVVALGVAAATLGSAVSLGGGGFGGPQGDAPSAGDGSGDPGLSPSPGGDTSLAIRPLCYESLREPPAVLLLSGLVVGVAALAYRDTRSPLAALSVAAAVGVPIWLLWAVLTACGSPSTETEFSFGVAGPDDGVLPEGAAGGGGAGGGAGAASAPELLFALLVIAALVASVGVLLLAGGDDEATPGAGAAAEDDPEESEPDLAAVGRTAGKAADRIEESDADNEVFRAWRDMTAALDVDRSASSTPAEFAAAAVDAGVDEEPVATLTEVFERVRYGGADPTDDRERRAVEALRRIEKRYGDGERRADSTTTGGDR